MEFRLIDGCPCPALVAPYVHLVLKHAQQTAASIYRGEDARALLHAHGKHTQAEIHAMYPDISNPPGRSTHELRSDGVAKPGPVGRVLEPWEVGVDSGCNDSASKRAVLDAAHHYGWHIFHPYHRGVEGHHWGFAEQPRPNGHVSSRQISKIRATLPRK